MASQLVDSSHELNGTLSALNPGFLDMLIDFYSKYDRVFTACSLLCSKHKLNAV